MTEQNETPVLDLLAAMSAESFESSTLDLQTLFLVRMAALVAVDAPAASYLVGLGVAEDLEIDIDQVRGVLTAIAPIVGSPRIVSATGNMLEALGFAVEVAELEEAIDEAIEDALEDGLTAQQVRGLDQGA